MKNDKDWNKKKFEELQNDKSNIEESVGDSLLWDSMGDNQASRIASTMDGSIDENTESLEEIKNWMIKRLEDFKRVFTDRIT